MKMQTNIILVVHRKFAVKIIIYVIMYGIPILASSVTLDNTFLYTMQHNEIFINRAMLKPLYDAFVLTILFTTAGYDDQRFFPPVQGNQI